MIRRYILGPILVLAIIGAGWYAYQQLGLTASEPASDQSRQTTSSPSANEFDPTVNQVSFSSVDKLDEFYETTDVAQQSRHGTQYVVVESFPDDFGEIYSVERKKRLFRNVMLPIIRLENERLRSRRRRARDLIENFEADQLSADQKQELQSLRNRYEVVDEENHETELTAGQLNTLKQRVDVIPTSLALAQAANESAWGTSRFSLEANNIFGEWIYNRSKGLKPEEVDESAPHRIRIFSTIRDSVRNYMHNLNTHHAYEPFRELRAEHTESKNSLKLVQGLKQYSSEGEAYLDAISRLIRQNNYRKYDQY